MNKLNNIFLKVFLLLVLCVAWGGNASAERIAPNIVSAITSANENVRTTWCYVHFVNSSGGYVYCAANGNNLAFSGSKRVNNDNLWALIGTQSNFVLRNRNGLYAKWDGEKYVGTEDANAATPCTYTPNTNSGNTTYWNLHRVSASATTNWNPQGAMKEWGGDADGGSRMEFSVVSEDEWNAIINPNYHVLQYSPAPTASGWAVGTHWYKITNDRSKKNLAACDGYMDSNGYLKTRGTGTIAENTDQWCFVQDTNGKVTIYNKAAGPNKVLGSMTITSQNNVRTKLFGKDEVVANISKLYTIGANGSGYYVLIDGLTNGYWDDNTSSSYLASWQVTQAATSEGGRFIVSEVIPKGYSLKIINDNNYTVSYDNVEYHNGDILPMSIDDLDMKNLTGFRIDCTNKFVYGPVINKGLQTVTYTIKDMVTSVNDFTTGFYQLQLFDDNSQKVNNVNTRINGSAGNINTKSNTIYVMPYKDVPTGGDQNLAKYSGVPTYANEASTFFYIERNGNNLQLQSVNGHYATNDGRERANATRTASPVTSGYAFPDGHLQLTGWVIQGLWTSTAATGIEGPRVAYNGNNNYEKYNAAKVDLNQYSIYKVAIENATNASDIANDPHVVIVGGSAADGNNRGLSKVYRNGYLFFDRGYVPTAADFNLNGTTYDTNFRITMGDEVDGIATITFSEIPTAVPFRVIITGDKKDDEVITYHNNHRFNTPQPSMLMDGAPTSVSDGESFLFRLGITEADLLDCDFSSSAASRTNGTSFVYGPVIDWENHTITCEIREAITELPQTGWYQLKWDVSTNNNVAAQNRHTNAREDDFTNQTRDHNRFYVTMPKEGIPGRNEFMNYNVHPTNETTPLTFVKLVRSGDNVMIMSIDGRYMNEDGTASNAGSGYANPVTYVDGELDFRHRFPFPSFSYMVGKATDTHNYFYTTPAKFDHSNFEFYEVCIHYEGYEDQLVKGRSITYNGSAVNYSRPTVYSGGYLVFPSGTNITRSEFTINNTSDDDIVSVTIDKINHKIKIEVKLPVIIHRQHAVFDHLASVDAEHKPNNKFIQDGQGMISHPYASHFGGEKYMDNDRTMQNTSVFRITQYTKPGTRTECVLPFTKAKGTGGHVGEYQRWYNYETERSLDANVIDGNISRFETYLNGFCNFAVEGTNVVRKLDVLGKADIMLPIDKNELFVGVDASEFKDYSAVAATGNFIEPSLNERVIFHIISAHKMANELTTSGDTWWEEKTFYVPNIKRGKNAYRNNADLIPFDMPFSNYWIYKTGSKTNEDLMPIVAEDGDYNTLRSNLEIVVEGSAKDLIEVGVFDGNPGNIGSAPYINSNHFLYYTINGDNGTRIVPSGSHAVIKVYAKNGESGTQKYQLAKFTLNFQSDSEPLAITSVVNNPASTRSVEYFENQSMSQVASLTFKEKDVAFNKIPGRRNDGNEGRTYAFPIDFARTSYGYSPSYTYGNYSVTRNGYGVKYQPVSLYERNIKNGTNDMSVQDDYFFYIDAAETPGQVASVNLEGSLCPGARLYCYGWVGSGNFYDGSGLAASVVLELVGRRSDGSEKVLASYLPGTLTDVAYDSDGTEIRSLNYGRERSMSPAGFQNPNTSQLGVWQSVGFSFILKDTGFTSYEMRIINNCFTTAGGDYSLDDFRVFMNPPKGNVDFTIPLCSDKTRHAKIHADYDMLWEVNGVNEKDPTAKLTASYCFLDAELFDEYEEGGYKIKNLFTLDEITGNHNLKPEYSLSDVEGVINRAFSKALVGRRCTNTARDSENKPYEDHGFHSYEISTNYNSIPQYAYTDSKSEIVYREQLQDGIRRIVFKEDVVRGEMEQLTEETSGRKYYPHLRPSRTYYLVFSPHTVEDHYITDGNVGTGVFEIHTSCSFFGRFTTKDPMHVILDNADIESDLPIQAVCHGDMVKFHFDMPALKADKPIIDEAYCISVDSLDGKLVPSTHGARHYRYEPSFESDAVMGVIKNLPYDWWLGGKYDETHSYGATLKDYKDATHPVYVYNQPEDISHKHHGDHVNIAQAMTDFRFFYPDFGMGKTNENGVCTLTEADWAAIEVRKYNSDTGYGLLQSEINTIKDLVTRGIILLHLKDYKMELTAQKSVKLTPDELSQMTSNELNSQILNLALQLNDPSIQSLLPLKQLEGTVLEILSPAGRRELTFQEFDNLTLEQLQTMAGKMITDGELPGVTTEQVAAMPLAELRGTIETVLRAMSDETLRTFAMGKFPDLGHQKRAHLVIRALNIMSEETLAAMTDEQRADAEYVREQLRTKMINIFAAQELVVLKKMWHDMALKLTSAERNELLNGKTPDTMTKQELAVAVEKGLAKITDGIIADFNSDKYIHFTLVPIMPSQENFVDEPYIFCPEPRAVKVRLTSHEPVMLDGFADMPYPAEMDNVPVRLGMPQINETKASAAKTLRIPVRGLKKAAKNGEHAVKLDEETGYYNNLFLIETDDRTYQQTPTDGMAKAKEKEGMYLQMVGKVEKMKATYPTEDDENPDNYLVVKFANDMVFHEGNTYRVGVNYMEVSGDSIPTISCYGTMELDLKIVPEYQKWTAAVNADWTNDANWARADRPELNAGNAATGDKIDGHATSLTDASYISNAANGTASSFIPMYFTNVLFEKDTDPAVLYGGLTAAVRTAESKHFLQGLKAATATADAIYDMEVAPSTGAWHTNGNYECGLFGTYVANGVTFKPESQLVNAQHLVYTKAWVEYELTVNRWYTLASPLQNTFAGEWYAPTAGGRQMTPHFYGINYRHDLNHRFQPAIYQRSWDSDGNNPVYLKQGGTQDSYVMADWSYVYNDVKKEYSAGGFSVKVADDFMASKPADGKSLIRMPKADTEYTYYDFNNGTGEKTPDAISVGADRNRLWTDKLKTSESFQQTISNVSADNNYFLVGNPFMTNMDMTKFFEHNPGLEQKIWIMTAEGQDVSVKVNGSQWVGKSAVAPLQGFFVKGTGNTTTVTFTPDMQANSSSTETLLARPSSARQSADVIRVTAERDGVKSTAIVMLNASASDGYKETEDCETFVDGDTYDMPTVYTTSSATAQSINVRKSLEMVPMGIISSDDSPAVVTFELSSGISDLYLYDRQWDSYTKLTDGIVQVMSGNNSGRYFLTTAVTGIESVNTDADSVRKGVWSTSGKYCGESLDGLAPGIYIVNGVKVSYRVVK